MNRKDVMEKWDMIHRYIKEGDFGSLPRDIFESIIDGYDEEAACIKAENDRLRTALHDAINRPLGVVPDSALEFYEAERITICPDCGDEIVWYHSHNGMSRAVCRVKCQGWKVLREVDRHKGA